MVYYNSTISGLYDEILEIINWYESKFEYKRMTKEYKSNGYRKIHQKLDKNHLVNATSRLLSASSWTYEIRFVFINKEDKILFDLTWK